MLIFHQRCSRISQTITQMLTSGLRSEDKERVDMLCECPEMTSQRSCYCSNPSQILDQISLISAKRNSPSFPLALALHSRLTLQKWLTSKTLPEGKTSALTYSHHVFSTLSKGTSQTNRRNNSVCVCFSQTLCFGWVQAFIRSSLWAG